MGPSGTQRAPWVTTTGTQTCGHSQEKAQEGNLSLKEHFHPARMGFFVISWVYSKLQGPVTRLCGLCSWSVWKRDLLPAPEGWRCSSQLDVRMDQAEKCPNLHKHQVFFSHLHQKIPRVFLASRLSSPSNKSQLDLWWQEKHLLQPAE